MEQIRSLLYLRIKQFLRAIQSVGIIVFLFLIFLVSGVLLQLYQTLCGLPDYFALIFSFFFLFSIDFQRKDKLFLKGIFKDKEEIRALLFFEYILLLSPILIFQILSLNWMISLLLFFPPIIVAFVSPFIKQKEGAATKSSVSFIPLTIFEIKFHLEQRKAIYLITYLLGFLSFIHIAFFLISIFFLTLFVTESFKMCEPREMIHWKKNYVLSKIGTNLKFIVLALILPLSLVLLFNWELKWLIFYMILFLVIMTFTVISYKYSNYSPLRKGIGSSNFLAILLIFSLLPGGILINLAFGLYHYFQSEKNLQYLYA